MSDESDGCDCPNPPNPTPTPDRGSAGRPLPDANSGLGGTQVQLMIQRGQDANGNPNTQGIEGTPQGELKVAMRVVPAKVLQQYTIRAGDVIVYDPAFISFVAGSGS